ncbi:MAG: NAD(P)-dependent glycerol-3-phosphate dehydrogenase [Betaproteobacteria bacterium]|nr:NAD(P)-dependent glycerol-3-phosphate dehydrogenase [Betaproteobacteria bacterium]
MKVAILGAGAWGTALAITLSRSHDLTLWVHDANLFQALFSTKENQAFLPGIPLPRELILSPDFADSVAHAELAVVAAPLLELRNTLRSLRQTAPTLPFLWVCKGLEANTGLLPHQVAAEEMSDTAPAHGVLTGPSFAEEVARGLPTAVTLASTTADFARRQAQALSSPRLRIYAGSDVVGAEVGGAVKNVLAIAAGICDGLGLGLNARAALITRGLAETVRFAVAMGGRRETLMGLAGMGDLILTCTGDLSRNRRVGLALAKGQALADITRDLGHVAEGVPSAREVARRARQLNVDMPIIQTVCALLDGALSAPEAVAHLMSRDTKEE